MTDHSSARTPPPGVRAPGQFEAPRPPAPPTRRTQQRRSGRFATGLAMGAFVGASVAGGFVALAGHGEPAVVTAAAVTTARNSSIDALSNPIAPLVATAEPSVVSIHDSMTQTDPYGRTMSGQAAGSGFVLSADGYVVTNDHVVDGATDITVNFADGSSAPAQLVAADPNSDLAVLKVDRSDLVPLAMGSSASLQVGDQLVAIGNALDLSGGPTVTTGIVSATGRSVSEPNGVALTDMIQTDTAINPGNSGGPLLDMNGQVVGINTVVAGQAQNIGFAISIDQAKAMIDQLRNGTVPSHAVLGVVTQPREKGAGVTVVNVDPASGAAAGGLQAGDVITAVDDTAIDVPESLAAAIAGHHPGDHISVTIDRNGSTETIDVTLGTRSTSTS